VKGPMTVFDYQWSVQHLHQWRPSITTTVVD
jgi:hypothetical protein